MANKDLAPFATELNQWRRAKEWSYETLAKAMQTSEGIQVTGSAVGEWCRGESEPSRDKVFALERIFSFEAGHLARFLGYQHPDAEAPAVTYAHLSDIHIAASGIDLNELAQLDPEAYEAIMRQAEIALDRARGRRRG